MKIMTCKEVLIEKIVNIITEAELDNSTDYETQIYLHVLGDGSVAVVSYQSVGGNSWLHGDGLYCIGSVKGAYETLGEIWTDSPEELCKLLGLDRHNVVLAMFRERGLERTLREDLYKYLDERYHDRIREVIEDMMKWMYRSEYWVKAEGMLDEWSGERDVEWMATTDREEV